MKIELEGREALQHTNAVHTLHSLGYRFVGAEWVAPQEEPQEEAGSVFIDEALITHPNRRLSDRAVDAIIADVMSGPEMDAILDDLAAAPSPADQKLQADIEALAARVNTLENDPLVSIRFAFDKHTDEALRRAVRPGGVLYGLRK